MSSSVSNFHKFFRLLGGDDTTILSYFSANLAHPHSPYQELDSADGNGATLSAGNAPRETLEIVNHKNWTKSLFEKLSMGLQS